MSDKQICCKVFITRRKVTNRVIALVHAKDQIVPAVESGYKSLKKVHQIKMLIDIRE